MKALRHALLVLVALAGAYPAYAEQIQPPSFSPAPGPYRGSQVTVTIQCGTPAVTIFYTTNGSDPTPSSNPYKGGFSISGTTTVKARAYKYGMTESRIVSGTYSSEQSLRQVPAPVLRPPSQTFTAPELAVAVTCSESGAVLRYTTNGSDPTAGSQVCTGNLKITETTTVKVRAFKSGMADSPVTTAVYVKGKLPPVPAPVLDKPSQTFTFSQFTVSARCPTSGAVLRYTLDGRDPTSSSAELRGGVVIDRTTTFKVRAFKEGMAESAVTTGVYIKGNLPVALAPALQPSPQTFTEPLDVGRSDREGGAVIRYTVDGNDPTASSPEFDFPIRITKTTMVKARAFKEGKAPSAVTSGVYTWVEAKPVAAPALQPPSHTFEASELTVGASCSESGAVIRYTTNGSDPTSSSPVFPGKLTIRQTTTVKVRAFKAGKPDSPVVFAIYTKGKSSQAPAPVFDPSSGQLPPPYRVRISCRDSRAAIVFTKDGSEPSLAGSATFLQGGGSIEVSPPMTLKARAFVQGLDPSSVVTASYTRAQLKPVPAPVLQPPSHTFTSPELAVGASCSESGAVIRYTTNGSDPTASSQVFPARLTISQTTTVKVRAFKAGMADSPVTTAVYTKGALRQLPAPALVPLRQRFTPPFEVTMGSSESGAEIRYTLDGSEPTASSPRYVSPIRLTETKTIKARAFKAGMTPSMVVAGVYERDVTPVMRPVLIPPSKSFTPPFEVLMGCEDRQAEIRYTLDGSEPIASSPRYTGPVRLTETKTIKARAFKAGMTPSEVVMGTYTRLVVTPTPAKGVVTPEERAKSAEECAKVLALQKEVERLQKEIERIRKERTERRKKLGLDPDPDCRIR